MALRDVGCDVLDLRPFQEKGYLRAGETVRGLAKDVGYSFDDVLRPRIVEGRHGSERTTTGMTAARPYQIAYLQVCRVPRVPPGLALA